MHHIQQWAHIFTDLLFAASLLVKGFLVFPSPVLTAFNWPSYKFILMHRGNVSVLTWAAYPYFHLCSLAVCFWVQTGVDWSTIPSFGHICSTSLIPTGTMLSSFTDAPHPPILEQNPRIVWVGRDLQPSPSPTTVWWAETSSTTLGSSVQPNLECWLPLRINCSSSFQHPRCKKFISFLCWVSISPLLKPPLLALLQQVLIKRLSPSFL